MGHRKRLCVRKLFTLKTIRTFSHWFSTLRGYNGEKHDSFIDLNYKTGDIIVDFSGTKLFAGETDGSRFFKKNI
jgi:glutamine synthetase type III